MYDKNPDWSQERGTSRGSNLNVWWTHDLFPPNITELLAGENAAQKWGELKVATPEISIAENEIAIILEGGPVGQAEKSTHKFGCVELTPGYAYATVDVAKHAAKYADEAFKCKMVVLEYDISKLDKDARYMYARMLWIVWREVALYRSIVRASFVSLEKFGAKEGSLGIWLALAG
jgi:hypothetical protein